MVALSVGMLAPALAQSAPLGTPAQPQPTAAPQAQPQAAAAPQAQPQAAAPAGQNVDQTNPRIFGMEVPLLDPASDTVSYNGGFYDVGNNAAVRARFEKYLQQNPETGVEAKRYREGMERLLKLTRNNARSGKAIGGETMVKIGHGLYALSDCPIDGGQAGALASSMASALATQFANRDRDRTNQKLQDDIKKLVEDTNTMMNRNTGKGGRAPSANARTGKASAGDPTVTNSFKISQNTKTIAANEARQVKNDADSVAALAVAKINYQSMLVTLLLSRRYDHAIIGANSYRHIFRDGNTTLQLKKDSKVSKLFNDVAGLPPTVNSIASAATTARTEVDQHIEAVSNLLAQGKLSDATQHLIEAVAVGEYMESVATFPAESRRRIAEYWDLRKKALTSLNYRDYGTAEEIATKMKALDKDFDDSLLVNYCAGKKQESDLALRNAMKALQSGDDEKFNEYIKEAGRIWPRNPRLKEGQQMLVKIDNHEPIKNEFRVLLERKDYRTIYAERTRFEVVALDPDLKEPYSKAVSTIAAIDALLKHLDGALEDDFATGACMAYETLLNKKAEDEEVYDKDPVFTKALTRYADGAHDFVDALKRGKTCEKRGEYGSALSNYYRAMCLYPHSSLAQEGVNRVLLVLKDVQFK